MPGKKKQECACMCAHVSEREQERGEKTGKDGTLKEERGSLMGRREKARKRGDAKVPRCFLSD